MRTITAGWPYLTVDLSVRFKSPTCSTEIFAEARPRHLKGKFFQTEVRVMDKQNKLVAEAQVKSFLPHWDKQEARLLQQFKGFPETLVKPTELYPLSKA